SRADLVLIDSAPMLGIGDALSLTSKVDGLILITRLNLVRRAMLRELDRALSRCQTKTLGIVATGATANEAYGYAYGCGTTGDPRRRPQPRHSEADEWVLWW